MSLLGPIIEGERREWVTHVDKGSTLAEPRRRSLLPMERSYRCIWQVALSSSHQRGSVQWKDCAQTGFSSLFSAFVLNVTRDARSPRVSQTRRMNLQAKGKRHPCGTHARAGGVGAVCSLGRESVKSDARVGAIFLDQRNVASTHYRDCNYP